MNKRKKADYSAIIYMVVFAASFASLRAIFDKIEWNFNLELLTAAVVSGVVAVILTPLLFNAKTYRKGLILSGVYLLILISIICFLYGGEKDSNVEIGDVWSTKEADGENFIIDFFRKDSIRVIFPPEDKRVFGYIWSEDKLKLYDDDEFLLFNWTVQLEKEKLIITGKKEDDKLVFYKK